MTSRCSPGAAIALLCVLSPTGRAQSTRQPTGSPPHATAPAAVLSSINQVPGRIAAQVWFQVPPGTAAILVSRAAAGGAAQLVTPNPVPLASIAPPTGHYYSWIDSTLKALGSFTYAVAAIQGDGRTGTSAPLAYAPRIDEPQQVTVTKPNPFTAVVTFRQSRPPARVYRLYGTSLVSYGVQAVVDPANPLSHGTVTIGSLAAGTYTWVLRAEYAPGIRTQGVPVIVTLP